MSDFKILGQKSAAGLGANFEIGKESFKTLNKSRELAKLAKTPVGDIVSNPEETKEAVASQFEALFLQQILKQMWQSAYSFSSEGPSRETQIFTDMFNEKLAEQMASTQSIGIKDMVLKEVADRAASEKAE